MTDAHPDDDLLDGEAFERERLAHKIAIIEGLLEGLSRWPELSRVVAESSNRQAALTELMEQFSFSAMQAQHVLDTSVACLAEDAQDRIRQELRRLRSEQGIS